jgi:hypothetical protein
VVYKNAGADSAFYGTYVNVWERQGDGSWKYMLNSGNEGLGDPVGREPAPGITDSLP